MEQQHGVPNTRERSTILASGPSAAQIEVQDQPGVDPKKTSPKEVVPVQDYSVVFDTDHDPGNPKNWSTKYKWLLVVIMSGMALTSNINVLVCAPAIPSILQEFDSTNSADGTLIVSIWNLGATVGCLFMGPLSEVYGRQLVYNVANVLCILVLVSQTQSRNIGMVLAFRCLNGLTVAATALNPSIVGDIFVVEERGRAQSLLSLMPLLGPVIGPIAGGWIAQTKGWRWAFWFTTFFLAVFSIAFALVYRETHTAHILRRRAKKLRERTGNRALRSRFDFPDSLLEVLGKALSRPFRIFRVPIFLMIVTPGCIVTGYTYLIAANITTVYESVYDFSEGAAGLLFLGLAVGMAAGAIFCSLVLDPYTKSMMKRHEHIKPEWRLPPMLLGFFFSPLGLFLSGWTAEFRVQYVVPVIGTGLIGLGSYTIVIPMTTYFADAFGVYRASAMSAMNMFRNGLSTVLPLAGPALYQAVGLGWGNSVLAFIALGLSPVPILLLRFGERVRKHSKLDDWE